MSLKSVWSLGDIVVVWLVVVGVVFWGGEVVVIIVVVDERLLHYWSYESTSFAGLLDDAYAIPVVECSWQCCRDRVFQG